MKLSEAILLGSTVLAPKAGGQFFSETQQGCALGMAAVARGCTFRTVMRPIDDRERRTLGVEGIWGSWLLQRMERPCDCWRIWIRRKMRIKDIITHLFDYHVMDKRDWSIEQLAAWVKSVEPDEGRHHLGPSFVLQQQQLEAVRTRLQEKKMRQEEEEWQAVRDAFEARHASRRRKDISKQA